MPFALYAWLLWLSTSGLVTANPIDDSHTGKPHRGLAPTNVDFGFNLYNRLAAMDPHKNVLISPVSISTALVMMSHGASGPTKTKLFQEEGFNITEMTEDEIYQSFQQLSHLLSQSDSHLKMNMGNAMFLDQSLNPRDSFLADIKKYHESEAVITKSWPEASQSINKYVESKTQRKMTDVFSEEDHKAPLVLVNYIFLRGMWQLPINPKNTKEEDFHVNETITVRVPMMFQSGNVGYLRDTAIPCQLVQMKYLGNGNGTTFLILPDQGKMDTVTAALNRDTVERWDKTLTKRQLNLYIPKVSMTGTYDLKDVLAGMGIADLFANQSIFSGITQDSLLQSSKMLHKALLQLDETGEPTRTTRGAPLEVTSEPLTVKFDRPFIILMFDGFTWSSLLMAKIMNPA
ncbi:corticosteroid-binding globulin [Alexandromys fortis]|uniref:corticosteroid-binding globulin n=1 Tax=Alexandromys fortis TaxID=100897 RepID=UPI0021529DD7|nr:corticosteroid-binding globulin [Microtus fortis]